MYFSIRYIFNRLRSKYLDKRGGKVKRAFRKENQKIRKNKEHKYLELQVRNVLLTRHFF